MSTEELARTVGRWVKSYNFCTKVLVRRELDQFVVSFESRTTSTRSSSMVTRLGLMAAQVLPDSRFQTGKVLTSPPPEDRSALATWRIFVAIPVKVRKEAA